MKKVYVIYTGGTIGMTESDSGLKPAIGFLTEKVKEISVLKNNELPDITITEYDSLIDSSQITIEHWNKIATDIYSHYDDYDGFVVLHGTDTMAYTGSALSFMLMNLSKPVILTGAQTPLSRLVSDARENLINSIYIAANCRFNEVFIYFNRTLFRANRTTKISTESYDAYGSPNYPVLATIGSSIHVNHEFLTPIPRISRNLAFTTLKSADIRCIRLTPNLTAEIFKKMATNAQAVIIEAYGDGNMPVVQNFLDALKEICEKSIVINRSQCLQSATSYSKYDVGHVLGSCGLISAGDQTIEALVCKLLYLFSINMSSNEIKQEMQRNISGELTISKQKSISNNMLFKRSAEHFGDASSHFDATSCNQFKSKL